MAKKTHLVPGVCGVVPGSVHPRYTGLRQDFRRRATSLTRSRGGRARTWSTLSEGLELSRRADGTAAAELGQRRPHRAGESGAGRCHAGWNLLHTAQDELFAAIEGTAFHTRIILERMAEHGVRVDRVINAGGIPQKNEVLNQVYANVLNKPVLVPAGIPTSLGSGILALLAAGIYRP